MKYYLIQCMHYASEVLENMSTDNAVDILNELSNSKVASLLALMDNRVTDKIKSYYIMKKILLAVS